MAAGCPRAKGHRKDPYNLPPSIPQQPRPRQRHAPSFVVSRDVAMSRRDHSRRNRAVAATRLARTDSWHLASGHWLFANQSEHLLASLVPLDDAHYLSRSVGVLTFTRTISRSLSVSLRSSPRTSECLFQLLSALSTIGAVLLSCFHTASPFSKSSHSWRQSKYRRPRNGTQSNGDW